MLYQRFLRLSIFVLISAALASARDLALVSNKSNTVGTITLPDLVKVCKAQTNRWPDGKPVTFVNHGRPNHPAILVATSDEDLVNKVASLPGAIGVVDVYSINSSVAVVKVAGKLPLEPGYLLHGN